MTTATISFQKGKAFQKGTWFRAGNTGTVFATCPNGHMASLGDHEIANDGTVTPSVVCDIAGCGFHEYIKLEGWSDGEM